MLSAPRRLTRVALEGLVFAAQQVQISLATAEQDGQLPRLRAYNVVCRPHATYEVFSLCVFLSHESEALALAYDGLQASGSNSATQLLHAEYMPHAWEACTVLAVCVAPHTDGAKYINQFCDVLCHIMALVVAFSMHTNQVSR